jgi:hypothetical protein
MSTLPQIPPHYIMLEKPTGGTFSTAELTAIGAVANVTSISTADAPNVAVVAVADVDGDGDPLGTGEVDAAARELAHMYPGIPVKWVTVSTGTPP